MHRGLLHMYCLRIYSMSCRYVEALSYSYLELFEFWDKNESSANIASSILEDILDIALSTIKGKQDFHKIQKDQQILYQKDRWGERILLRYCKFTERYPDLIEEVVVDVDLTITPGKYLGHVLRLLQHVCEVAPSYKFPSNYVDSLWDILDSSNCDAETRAIAGSLLLRDCSSTETDARQKVVNKVLELYSKRDGLTGVEGTFLKDFIDIYIRMVRLYLKNKLNRFKKY